MAEQHRVCIANGQALADLGEPVVAVLSLQNRRSPSGERSSSPQR